MAKNVLEYRAIQIRKELVLLENERVVAYGWDGREGAFVALVLVGQEERPSDPPQQGGEG